MRDDAGADFELAVVYKSGTGEPLKERMITFDAGEIPADLATLSAFSAYTDQQGVAKVTLKSHGLAGSVVVQARQSSDPHAVSPSSR